MNISYIYKYLNADEAVPVVRMLIWCIFIGLVIGEAVMLYNKSVPGALVRLLLKADAVGHENGALLSEIGIEKPGALYKNILRDGKTLRKYVGVANPEECMEKVRGILPRGVRRFFLGYDEPAPRYNPEKAKVYIINEKRWEADVRYDKKGSSLMTAVITAALLLVAAIGLSFAAPAIVKLADNAVAILKNLKF